MLSLRLALREIRNHPRFSAFFVLNLALGLAGFVALDGFGNSVARELVTRSKSFLGADLGVVSSQQLSIDEVRALDREAGEVEGISQLVELFSMVGRSGRARLAEIRAIDSVFPLYGDVVLRNAGRAGNQERTGLAAQQGAWVDPALLSQLDIELGDEITIGHTRFRVLDVISHESARAASGVSIAPRIYVSTEHLAATGLITAGSRVRYKRLYRLAPGGDERSAATRMRALLDDPRVSVRTHEEATRELARVYGAVGDYLGLVSLIAIFLAGIGAAHLFRAFLARRLRDLAILMSLGSTRGRAQCIFLAQLWLLSLLGGLVACALGGLLMPGLAAAARVFVPATTTPRIGVETLVSVVVIALLCSTVACLPLVVRIRSLRPADLFREHAHPTLERGRRELVLLAPALACFFGLSLWRSGDLFVGALFSAIFTGSLLVLAAAGHVGLAGVHRLSRRSSAWGTRGLSLRLALRQLAGRRAAALPAFVAIALCTLLVSVPAQMRGVLDAEIDPANGSALPSLFLFDIQPEQLAPLVQHVADRGSSLQTISPLVRARLEALNGEPIHAAQETGPSLNRVAEAQRLRARRYNLTYRERFTEAERLVAGSPFSGAYDSAQTSAGGLPEANSPAEISLEVRFAERLGVGLGDVLGFDVQGVPIAGRVVSLREVRWNSFQPNFFVSFQPGVLEEAPKIFLASVPGLPSAEREALQSSIVEHFPNVSAIDVTATVKRMLGLMKQLDWALLSTAWLALAVGFVLVYAIARDEARSLRWETNLLKVLGAHFRQIRSSVDLEFGALGLFASLTGVAASLAVSAIFAHSALDLEWRISWGPLALVLLLVPSICIATSRLATRAVLRERPLVLLQAAED